MRSHFVPVISAVLFAGLASCKREIEIVPVSGTVALDGRPLAEGVIVFEPTDPARGQVRQASIVNGAFSIPNAEGVFSGLEFRVVVRGFRKTGRRLPYANPDGSWDEIEQYLPKEYNTATTLKVTAGADPAANQFAFELQSRPGSR